MDGEQKKGNGKKTALQNIISRLEEYNRRIEEIIGDHVPCQLGSLLRIACQYLENWGIETKSLGNKDTGVLDKHSHNEYKNEWEAADPIVHQAIEGAIIDSNLGEGNQLLNTEVARLAADIILNEMQAREKIAIADIGAGTGNTTGSMLDELRNRDERVLEQIEMYFIEPCDNSHLKIKDLMAKYPKVEYQRIIAMDYAHLGILREGVFDLVVSNAVFHHHSFPFYLNEINSALKKGGFLIMGDWYTEVWHHPYTTAYLLREAFRVEQDIIIEFMRLFNEKAEWKDANDYWLGRPEDETVRNNGMLLYTKNLASRLKEKEDKKVELKIFEAHERYEERLAKLNQAGFITDAAEIQKIAKRLKNTEKEVIRPKFAMVTVACKK